MKTDGVEHELTVEHVSLPKHETEKARGKKPHEIEVRQSVNQKHVTERVSCEEQAIVCYYYGESVPRVIKMEENSLHHESRG